jgi:hypothetical protein
MPSAERYARDRADQTTIWVSKTAAAFLTREREEPTERAGAVLDRLLTELRRLRRAQRAAATQAAASSTPAPAARRTRSPRRSAGRSAAPSGAPSAAPSTDVAAGGAPSWRRASAPFLRRSRALPAPRRRPPRAAHHFGRGAWRRPTVPTEEMPP